MHTAHLLAPAGSLPAVAATVLPPVAAATAAGPGAEVKGLAERWRPRGEEGREAESVPA